MTTTQKQLPKADDLRDDVVILTHRDTCPAPKIGIFVGRMGDQMIRCKECGRTRELESWMLTSPDDLMRAIPEPPEDHHGTDPAHHVRSAFSTSYVCREHPDCPVTWKGKGCSRCAARDIRKTKKTTPEGDEPR
ncbi:MAG: hypothetical protein ACTHU1_13285 [Arachnia sp.]